MIDERISTFLYSLETPECPLLEEIEQRALEERVPIIRKETQSFLKVLMRIVSPRNILELGTAVGFSALVMERYAPEGLPYHDDREL